MPYSTFRFIRQLGRRAFSVVASVAFILACLIPAGATASKPDGHIEFNGGKLHAHLYWEKGPIAESDSTLRVEFKEPKHHKPVAPDGQLSVELWEPEMGHGSEPTKIQSVLSDKGAPVTGSIRVSNILFSMAGKWELRFKLKNADGKTSDSVWKVTVTDPNDEKKN